MGQVVDLSQLLIETRSLRAAGRSLVTTNGSFDLFHVGHLEMLEFAKRQGNILIVGINSDASCRAYKGPDRPIVPCSQRMRLVAALICTDYVFSFDELDPRAFLEQLKPDVHVNGAEYGENCIEADTVRRNGGRLVLFPRIEGLATTEMLNKAQRMASELLPSERNPGRIL